MKRVITAELLDSDAGTPEEIASSLGDLQRINLWFGGITTTAELVRRVADELHASSLSLLEVAAGSGYVPESVKSGLRSQGIYLRVTVLDRAVSHLNSGRRVVVGDCPRTALSRREVRRRKLQSVRSSSQPGRTGEVCGRRSASLPGSRPDQRFGSQVAAPLAGLCRPAPLS